MIQNSLIFCLAVLAIMIGYFTARKPCYMVMIPLFYFGHLASVCLAFLLLLIGYFKWSFQYWHKKSLPYLKPQVPFGNIGPAIRGKENLAVTMKRIYEKIKAQNWKHGGIYFFSSPTYIPVNLECIKNIMTKDFQFFTDHNSYHNEKEDPLNGNLVFLTGQKWRTLRTKLTPIFTPGKMKMMFETLANCQEDLLKRMCVNEPLNIKEIVSSFTTDIMGSCVFGLDCKSHDENSQFQTYVKKVFEYSIQRRWKRIFCVTYPKLASFLNVSVTPKDITNFFMKVAKDTVEYREKNNYRRNDFVQLLIDMKNNGASLTIEEIAAQCAVFFLAGSDSSSTLMAFALYELARNPDIQQKVRDEVTKFGKITYDSLQDLKYLNQVIDETLRMHPPSPLIDRKCVKDYKIPNENVILERGTTLYIPILGIHHDPEYYPDPEKFDPERFNEENKSSRHGYAHIPFGQGPRTCIGMRFALMQARVGLSCLIKNYKFTVSSKTREPLEIQADVLFALAAVGGIWLNAEKLV